IASGSAFLMAQLLDVVVFDRLRRLKWWIAPLSGALLGSCIDTALFFSVASADRCSVLAAACAVANGSPRFPVPIRFGTEVPLWMSLAFGHLCVKIVQSIVMLVPYGALLNIIRPVRA